MGLFDYSLFIPRQTGKQLESLAEEVNFYIRKDWDSHDLGAAVLNEFVKIHRQQSYKDIARLVTGNHKLGIEEEELPRIRFFAPSEKSFR